MKATLLFLVAGIALAGCSRKQEENGSAKDTRTKDAQSFAPKQGRTPAESRAARLETAASLFAEGFRRQANGESQAAFTCFSESYKTRRELLGPLDKNTCASLEGMALGGGSGTQPETVLNWLGELETATTNLYAGQDLTNRLSAIYQRRITIYETLGRTAEVEATQAKVMRLSGFSDAQIARQAESMKVIEARAEATAREIQQQIAPMFSNLAPQLAAVVGTNANVFKAQSDTMRGAVDELFAALQGQARIGSSNGTPVHKTEGDLENILRAALGSVATNHPGLQAALERRKPKWDGTLEEWFEHQWEKWNDAFDRGTSLNRLVGEKQYSDPLLMLPGEAGGSTMSLLALNLKALLLEREFRLQAALAQSADPAVAGWRDRLWDLQVQSLRARPLPIDPASQGFAPREVLENSPFTLIVNEKLEKEQRKLRVLALALPGAGRRTVVKPEEVRQRLTSRSVLVEFMRYGRDLGGLNRIEERFGAVVIVRDKEPVWVDLGTATNITAMVAGYVDLMRKGENPAPAPGDAKAVLEKLYGTLWLPLEPALPPDAATVFLAADSDLHLLSFATLVKQGRFLGESHDFVYVVSGRDLLETNRPATGPRLVDIWADADFDRLQPGAEAGAEKKPSRASAIPPYRAFGSKFGRLAGTRREATELKEVAEKQGGYSAHLHLAENANESGLREVERPFILHLGTHGMFLPMQKGRPGQPWVTGGLRNQFNGDAGLFQSGIALAGANRTIDAWLNNELPSPDDDGIVVAAEAARLNLRGTWLVTLSACDTGTGGVADGESLLGIKLGFLQAGAQNVCASLWRVNDSYAPGFIRSFYEGALRGNDAAGALAKVQRAELKRLSADGSRDALWKAAKLAGPFVITVRGQ